MEKLSLLEKFVNPELMKNLSMGDKVMASLYVMILGMGATFVALCILWGLIAIMTKMVSGTKKETEKVVEGLKPIPRVTLEKEEENKEELVAVITAAIAASMQTSTNNIVVTNIPRVVDGNN